MISTHFQPANRCGWVAPRLCGCARCSSLPFLTAAMAIPASAAFVLLLAPLIGSFLGVVIVRLPQGRAIAWDRSRCPACNHRLGPLDLAPIASWLFSAARCRYCAAAISPFYPAIELAALGGAAWAVAVADGPLALWASCGLAWWLIALAVIDARDGLLPDALTLPLIPAGLALTWVLSPADLPAHLAGCAAGYLSFACLVFLYRTLRGREGLGLGDAKLLAGAGAWLSWQGLPSLVFLAALFSLMSALLLRGTGRPVTFASRLAFGPGLCAGFWLVWLYGPLG
jgi:leader peptidase (prepilin peptidase)/N-methyltransferase